MGTWSERVLQKWESTNVSEEIDGIGKSYKKWYSLYIALIGGGGAMTASSQVPYLIGIGIFLVLLGTVNIAATALWVHIRLSTLRIVFELQRQKKL